MIVIASDEMMVSGLKGLLESAGLYSNLDSSDDDDNEIDGNDNDDDADSDVSVGEVEDFSIGEISSGAEKCGRLWSFFFFLLRLQSLKVPRIDHG